MNERQLIIFGETGQNLIWDCPEGRPSATTTPSVYRIGTGDSGTAESATTGGVTTDSVNTTVDAASGPSQSNPRKLNVTATSNMAVDRRFLVTGSGGEYEWFLVKEIASADYVICASPLKNDYVATNTVVGTRLTIAVNSTFVASTDKITDDQDPNAGYRVRWEYTVNSTTCVHDAYFDLVRYTALHTVQPIDLENAFPNWRDRLATYHQDDEGRRIIDQAYQDVRFDFWKADQQLTNLRSRDGLNRLVMYRANAINERNAVLAGSGDVTAMELATREYQSELDQLVRVVSRLSTATSTSGAGNRVNAVSIMSK